MQCDKMLRSWPAGPTFRAWFSAVCLCCLRPACHSCPASVCAQATCRSASRHALVTAGHSPTDSARWQLLPPCAHTSPHSPPRPPAPCLCPHLRRTAQPEAAPAKHQTASSSHGQAHRLHRRRPDGGGPGARLHRKGGLPRRPSVRDRRGAGGRQPRLSAPATLDCRPLHRQHCQQGCLCMAIRRSPVLGAPPCLSLHKHPAVRPPVQARKDVFRSFGTNPVDSNVEVGMPVRHQYAN